MNCSTSDPDRGRPLAHLTPKLDYSYLLDDAVTVLCMLIPQEREVSSIDSHWYLVRLLPYRTVDNRIEGVRLFAAAWPASAKVSTGSGERN